jgi:hypothetical protein
VSINSTGNAIILFMFMSLLRRFGAKHERKQQLVERKAKMVEWKATR